MLKNDRFWCSCRVIGVLFFTTLLLTVSAAQARNPDLSFWTKNLSESAVSTELGEYDFGQEIAVVGTTVHVMWITRNVDWTGYKIFYRRSTDNGRTWGAKQELFESNDMVVDASYRRMAVAGNNVHIAVSHYEGSWYGVLTYLRSSDNGASFETPRNVFTAAAAYHVYDVYIAAEGSTVTIGFRNQCNWKVDNSYMLKISDDSGDTFADKTAYSIFESGSSWKVSDMQRVGNNIYVAYTDSYYYYGLQYSKLYIAHSANAGVTFASNQISIPSQNGADKTYPLQYYHYVPKIAGVGNEVSVIWSGMDSNDVSSVFFRHSYDSGANWDTVKNLTTGLLPDSQVVQYGHETLAAKKDSIYSLILTDKDKIYVRMSTNKGASFSTPQELTSAMNAPYIEKGWRQVIATDPTDESGAKVHVLWSRNMQSIYCYSTDYGASFSRPMLVSPAFSYGGSGVNTTYMAIGQDGKVHFTGDYLYYSNSFGGYGEADIFYGSVSAAPQPGQSNKSLKTLTNSDDSRYDNMQVRASSYMNFTSTFTGEVWVKPYAGGITTGSTTYTKPIFHKYETFNYNSTPYALQTWDRYGKRQAQAQINTSDGVFTVNPSDSTVGIVPDDAWTHLAMTYDANGGANNLKLFMNGKLIASATATGNLVTGDGLFFVGRYGNWEVDELRLWNKVRTASDISVNMYKSLTGTEDGLNAYYTFNDTTRDITGHGNDGILMYQESYQDGFVAPPHSEFSWNLFLPAILGKRP